MNLKREAYHESYGGLLNAKYEPPDSVVSPQQVERKLAMLNVQNSITELTSPTAIPAEGGVDLLLPPSTSRDVLGIFVASCNIGTCDCETTFIARISNVDLYDEPGRLRIRITGDVTPEEVLTEMAASAPQLSTPS